MVREDTNHGSSEDTNHGSSGDTNHGSSGDTNHGSESYCYLPVFIIHPRKQEIHFPIAIVLSLFVHCTFYAVVQSQLFLCFKDQPFLPPWVNVLEHKPL
jgi:hypothetical protein